jgi:hypothetical protein
VHSGLRWAVTGTPCLKAFTDLKTVVKELLLQPWDELRRVDWGGLVRAADNSQSSFDALVQKVKILMIR